jgi:hypothetical protein
MKKNIEHSLVLVLAMLLVAMFVSPAGAASSVVHDPTGDVGSAAPYLDVAHAQVIEQQGVEDLLFMMQLAGRIPEVPSNHIWPFHVDTDASTVTFPGGPFNSYVDYVVRVRWLNGALVGEVVNRTPILTGGSPIITAVPFSIDGRTVKLFVPLETLGDPSSFGWNAATRLAATAPYVDFAPDGGLVTDLATWTK